MNKIFVFVVLLFVFKNANCQLLSLYKLWDRNSPKQMNCLNKKISGLAAKKHLPDSILAIHIFSVSLPDKLRINKQLFKDSLINYLEPEKVLNTTQSFLYNQTGEILAIYEKPALYKITAKDPSYNFYTDLANEIMNKKFDAIFYINLSNLQYLFEIKDKTIYALNTYNSVHYSLNDFIDCCWNNLFIDK